jgi:hypothetical protein
MDYVHRLYEHTLVNPNIGTFKSSVKAVSPCFASLHLQGTPMSSIMLDRVHCTVCLVDGTHKTAKKIVTRFLIFICQGILYVNVQILIPFVFSRLKQRKSSGVVWKHTTH